MHFNEHFGKKLQMELFKQIKYIGKIVIFRKLTLQEI